MINQQKTTNYMRPPKDYKQLTSENIAETIRELRNEKNITQNDIATTTGIARQTIIRLEKGEGKGTAFKTILLILAALDKTLVIIQNTEFRPITIDNLADTIRDLRTNNNLIQEDVAKKVGVTKQTIFLLESGAGVKGISFEKLINILSALGKKVYIK